MSASRLQSDQLDTWSDINAKRIHCHTAKTPRRPAAQTASAQSDSSRLTHRALQTMWQTGLQMRGRSRSWPQVLSFGELSGFPAANGLRPTGVLRSDCRVACQLSAGPRDFGGDLRDQPRTSPPSRGTLNSEHERSTDHRPCDDRCEFGRPAPRQHARRLARRQPNGFANCGDSQ
jgi:hypothetical protein